MAKNKKNQSEDGLQNIENTLSKTEQFIEKNQKILLGIMAGILVVVGGYWLYNEYVKKPAEQEALSQMFVAERNFEVDSFKLALNGYQTYPGFVQIADDYSGTKAGNLAKYYAGVCYINLGEYDKAIEYLKKFKTSDIMLGTISKGLIGDAYLEKGDMENAINFYKQATGKNINDFSTPIYLKKLGLIYEEKGDYKNALAVYEKIYDNHKKSQEARTIKKYIERAKLNIAQ